MVPMMIPQEQVSQITGGYPASHMMPYGATTSAIAASTPHFATATPHHHATTMATTTMGYHQPQYVSQVSAPASLSSYVPPTMAAHSQRAALSDNNLQGHPTSSLGTAAGSINALSQPPPPTSTNNGGYNQAQTSAGAQQQQQQLPPTHQAAHGLGAPAAPTSHAASAYHTQPLISQQQQQQQQPAPASFITTTMAPPPAMAMYPQVTNGVPSVSFGLHPHQPPPYAAAVATLNPHTAAIQHTHHQPTVMLNAAGGVVQHHQQPNATTLLPQGQAIATMAPPPTINAPYEMVNVTNTAQQLLPPQQQQPHQYDRHTSQGSDSSQLSSDKPAAAHQGGGGNLAHCA